MLLFYLDQPIYTWSSDNQTVTAKRICLNNGLHIEEETVTAQKIVKDPSSVHVAFLP